MQRLDILAPFGMGIPYSGGQRLTAAPNPVVHEGIIAVIGGSDANEPLSERTAFMTTVSPRKSWIPLVNFFSPPSGPGPTQWLFQGPPAESKLLLYFSPCVHDPGLAGGHSGRP